MSASSPGPFRFSVSLYRVLLRLYPRSFRERFGFSMERDLLEYLEHRARIGWLRGRVGVWVRILRDVAVSAPREWVQRARQRRRGTDLESGSDRVFSVRRLPGDLAQDLRVGLRGLGRTRAFTAIAVLSLGIGIGAITALLTVFGAVWPDSVPGVRDPERVVEVLLRQRGREMAEWSYPDFVSVRDASTPIAGLAGWKVRSGALGSDDGGVPVRVAYVTANYFDVLGVVPRGRSFLAAEDEGPGRNAVVILGHDLWQNQLAGDADIIGGTVHLNRRPYTVVGIAPEEFTGHQPVSDETDLWVPLGQHPFMWGERSLLEDRGTLWLQVLGRLRPRASRAEANAALHTVLERLASEYPETNEGRTARAAAFGPHPALSRTEDMVAMGAVLALAGVVLVIICGNVAGMVLARGASRERELAVRMALGSGRRRLVQQLLVETLVVAIAGGVTGVLFARLGLWLALPAEIAAMLPEGSLQPDASVLLITFVLALATSIMVGLLPALRFSRPCIVASIKDDAGGGGRRVNRVHRIAASAQTGVALLLLVVGGLFLRSVDRWDRSDPGFRPERLLLASMDLSTEGYASEDEALAFIDRVREKVAAVPGVAAVSVGDGVPLDLVGNYARVVDADRPDAEPTLVEFTRVSEEWFVTVGIPVVRGRPIERTDHASGERVVVITQSLADRIWPGEAALGRRLRFGLWRGDAGTFTVVGVTNNVASSRATEDQPHIFAALRQQYAPRIMLAVRTRADAAEPARAVRNAILAVDPGLAPPVVMPSASLVERATRPQRRMAGLASGLGLLALLLCAIGVYGVVAFTVAHRTREIGLRMAMGATRPRVLVAVLGDAVRLASPGLAVGTLFAAAAGATFRSILLSVSPLDPVAFGAAAALLFLVVIAASLVPARRASGVEPMVALRHE